jgi:diketogulonate reductase-like aldo/keto reductase
VQSILQVEMHPYFRQEKLVEFCKERNIVITAYSPLGNPAIPFGFRKEGDANILTEPLIVNLAKKYNKVCASLRLP